MRQLDEAGAGDLLAHVRALGIEVVLGDGVQRVTGDASVTGVLLRSERVLDVRHGDRRHRHPAQRRACARSRACTSAAAYAWTTACVTSDPHIHAVGECAEHRKRVYGFVAPGPGAGRRRRAQHHRRTGQLSRLAHRRALESARPAGIQHRGRSPRRSVSISAASGTTGPDGVYRKIVTWRGRLVGAIALGPCPELGRLQEGVMRGRRIWPWQLLALRAHRLAVAGDRAGERARVAGNGDRLQLHRRHARPAGRRGRGRLPHGRSARGPHRRLHRVRLVPAAARAACGRQRRGRHPSAAGSGCSARAAFALPAALALRARRPHPVRRDGAGAVAMGRAVARELLEAGERFHRAGLDRARCSLLSLRKRIRRFTLGDFPVWRVVHVVLGALTLAGWPCTPAAGSARTSTSC